MKKTTFALAIAALPAFAQERPPIMPTRDVTVAYRLGGEGPAGQQAGGEMRMSWLTGPGLMRMDLPGGQGFMVVNPQVGTGFMVMPSMRMVMDMPAGAATANNFARASQTARFTREGSDRVAGNACTIWRVEDRGDTARICTTADGVTLRAASVSGANGRGSMEATSVQYGVQDAGRFARPAGYQSMQMPGGGQLPGAPPASAPGGTFPNRGTALPPPGVGR